MLQQRTPGLPVTDYGNRAMEGGEGQGEKPACPKKMAIILRGHSPSWCYFVGFFDCFFLRKKKGNINHLISLFKKL